MRHETILICALVFASALAGFPGGVEAADAASFLTGNWQGVRDAWAERGLDIELVATTDIMALVDGGGDNGVETPANFDLVFSLDTGAAGWWESGTFLVYFLGNAGGDPSSRVGDLQVSSNIEAVNTFKLYEAFYEHRFMDERLSLRLGLHDLNSEFYVLEHAGLFINSSFGIGVEASQVGPSIFSTTALAARVRYDLAGAGYVMGAVYDGVPGDPNDPIGTQVKFADGDGVFVIGEAGITDDSDTYYKLGLGGWYQTTQYDDIAGRARDGNSGLYVIAERDLWRHDDGRGVGMFLQAGFADSDRNQVGSYYGLGTTWTGPLPGRGEDVAGFAIAHARNGDDFRRLNPGVERAETVLELSYLVAPTPWFTVQPDVQYVIDPGMDPGLDNALVVGVRLQLSL
jgi:porin